MKHLSYCNPLPLPDYPRGRFSRAAHRHGNLWMRSQRRDFRETADPSVLYHDGVWYLYPSAGMAYVSTDFVKWEHVRMEPYDIGYAPTVVRHGNLFLLTACQAPLYSAPHPLGPWTERGPFRLPSGSAVENWADPMLFGDDDGRLYAYWGLGGPGIFGAELHPGHPEQLLTEPEILFAFNPAHQWERFGEVHQNPGTSYVEGPWMLKRNGIYYLTYAAPGTQFRCYGMGVYVGESPLGPFQYQSHNPIAYDTQGLVHGPGHGCIVEGPGDTLWAFYTCLVRNEHAFERRVGLDPAWIDEHGLLRTACASETPQWAPGALAHPASGNDVGLQPVSLNCRATATSEAPGRDAAYANDHGMRTWWQAADDDAAPALSIDLQGEFVLEACRILWKEPGLDYDSGVQPGPCQYRIEISTQDDIWSTALDCTDNAIDYLIDYRCFEPVAATRVRLVVSGVPPGIGVGVIDFTVFGLSACRCMIDE